CASGGDPGGFLYW
nr:immunoglobulin heavy chain junction region [Mus musculus]